jgi:putative tryptophan/tyrosine transport system substrate-binding protein
MAVSRQRRLLVLGGVFAIAPAFAQRAVLPRIGFIIAGTADSSDARRFLREFSEGMRALGYQDGQNYRLDVRYYGNDRNRISVLADQLVALKPDVLVANVSSTASILRDRTSEIPIVMVTAIDPVGEGLAMTLARPGGNVTGMTGLAQDVHAKLLELSREMMPRLKRVGFLVNPGQVLAKSHEAVALRAAKDLRLELVHLEVRYARDVDRLADQLAEAQADALIVAADLLLFNLREHIIQVALGAGVPTIAVLPDFARRGALATYGPDVAANYRGAARYVDRILKGAKPGELAIEQPTQFELVLNVRTAKALRLTIPNEVLLRADRVIE